MHKVGIHVGVTHKFAQAGITHKVKEEERKEGIVEYPLCPGNALYALPRRNAEGEKPYHEVKTLFDQNSEYIGARELKRLEAAKANNKTD